MLSASTVLIAATVLFSYQGFRSLTFKERFIFSIDGILIRKEFYRLLSSGFLHANWGHLFWNMLGLYLFGDYLISSAGVDNFVIIYFVGMLGGDLLSLAIHKNHGDYTSLGASGAVNGIIFAFIALHPTRSLYLIILPGFSFPAWAFALGYLLISMYGMRSLTSTTAHEAHIGGAVVGILTCMALLPARTLGSHPLPILAVLLPAIAFMAVMIWKPNWLLLAQIQNDPPRTDTIEDRYHAARKNEEQELNSLLEKVSSSGYQSLTDAEKQRLNELSNR